MLPKFETSVAMKSVAATNTDATGGDARPVYISFIAPAGQELGGEIAVMVLADSAIGDADLLHAITDSIRQYFLSNPTEDVARAIGEALSNANTAAMAMPEPAGGRVSASVTVAIAANDRLFVGNVGNNVVYLLREDRIKLLTSGRSWVTEAQRSWNVEPGEIHDHGVQVSDALGKQDSITPDLAPIDFIWPGDTVMFGTAALATRLRAYQIREVIAANPPEPAAKKLVEMASEGTAPGDLAAVILHVPQPARAAAPIPIARPARPGGISPLVKALALVNLLLLCAIGVALARGGSSLLTPSPTVEIAKPNFVQTETAQVTPEVTVDPFARTPTPAGAPPLEPTTGPVAAPTLAPTTAPAPTFTPVGPLANWVPPPPPLLQLPAEGARFSGPTASVILSWDSAGTLPEDIFYVAAIRKWTNGTYIGESDNWTKSTRLRLDSSFYTAFNAGAGTGMAAPSSATGTSQFEWTVTLYRLTQIKPDGTLVGTAVTPPTPSRHFTWGPTSATPVYGSDNVPGDPFFADMRERTDSASNTLAPVSAGIAGLSILFGLLGLVSSRTRL